MQKTKIRKNENKRLRTLDLVVLGCAPLVASIVTFAFDVNFVVASLLFFGVPALYLSLRTPQYVLRALLFAFVATLGCVVINYFAIRDGSWYVPETVFGFRFLGGMVLDDIIWAFLLIYLVVIFYEHFFDKGRHKPIGNNLVYFGLLIVFLLLLFTAMKLLKPDLLHYFYLKAGLILLLLPVMALLISFPRYISIALKVFPYFFALNLLVLLTGLHQSYWEYPGKHFIGWLRVAGFEAPIEEVFFWVILFSTAIIAYFEFFDDNRARLPERIYKRLQTRFRI